MVWATDRFLHIYNKIPAREFVDLEFRYPLSDPICAPKEYFVVSVTDIDFQGMKSGHAAPPEGRKPTSS